MQAKRKDLRSSRGDEAVRGGSPHVQPPDVGCYNRLHRYGKRSGGSCGGFTLLELLIATAVGAVVLLVIQTTYFGALRLHNTTHTRIDDDAAVHRALGIVRRDLAGLMLPGGALSGQFQTEQLSAISRDSYGERIGPEIYTNSGKIDGFNPFSEVQMIAYYLSPAAQGTSRQLLRVATRNLLPVQEGEHEEQVILEGVAAASFSYYDGAGWIESWDSEATSTLPTAVRFSLVMASHEGGQTAAPVDLVVPVLVMTTTTQREIEEAAAP